LNGDIDIKTGEWVYVRIDAITKVHQFGGETGEQNCMLRIYLNNGDT